MEKLECGTKVLIFEDPNDIIDSDYSFGTIVSNSEIIIDSYEIKYSVKDSQDPTTVYPCCIYGTNIMTTEDYKAFLLKKRLDINNSIQELIDESIHIDTKRKILNTKLSGNPDPLPGFTHGPVPIIPRIQLNHPGGHGYSPYSIRGNHDATHSFFHSGDLTDNSSYHDGIESSNDTSYYTRGFRKKRK